MLCSTLFQLWLHWKGFRNKVELRNIKSIFADIYKENDSNPNVKLKIFTLQKAAHVNLKDIFGAKRAGWRCTLWVFKEPALRRCPGHLNMKLKRPDVC